MKTWITGFDLALGLGLLLSARQALFARDTFQAVAFFISYGLLMALAWVRLGAPDVALAEAAIGAGLTGALVLDAVRQLGERPSPTARPPNPRMLQSARVTTSLLAVAMIMAVWSLRSPLPGLTPALRDRMKDSGSHHPMTAVLLNFRAWDTWLELGVLFLASFSILVIHRKAHARALPGFSASPNPTLAWLAKTMLPFLVLVGGYLLWAGTHSPGGAFQAGALLGAAGVLMQLGGFDPLGKIPGGAFRFGLILGFCTFSLVAAVTLFSGRNLLEYPVNWAGALILIIETAATLSIALTLNVVYRGSRPSEGGEL